MLKKSAIKLSLIVLLLTVIASGCAISEELKKGDEKIKEQQEKSAKPTNLKEELIAQSQIKKFEDLDDLQEFLEENEFDGGYASPSWGGGREMAVGEIAMDSTAPMAKTQTLAGLGSTMDISEKSNGSDDFSKTNVQVEGVDEADIIKTDGKYIYALVKSELYIIDAYPANSAKVLSKISFKSRPQDIYINEGKLVIFGYDNQFRNEEVYSKFRRHGNYTFLKIFDIENPKSPKQVRDLKFEGNYSNSRMIGDYIYLITNNYNYYYIEDEPMLPRVVEGGEVYSIGCEDSLVRCVEPDVYYFDVPYHSYNFTSVYAINVDDREEEIGEDVYIMSSNQNMYVSKNNIYITYAKYISEYQLMMEVTKEVLYPMLSGKLQERIAKIEASESYILSKDEKMNKINQILERFIQGLTDEKQKNIEEESEKRLKEKYEDLSKELEKTVIHKVKIDGNNLKYLASGDVTGHVLNQFSMDESNGYFRIATTKNRTWSRFDEERTESYNNLYVLDENLKVVGSIEKLAKGERIYSVRFMQDRAYMVTFKQTDPLFVIDLKDPENPRVLGELKIPGYSDYLHPYNDDILIGLGKDTKETEWGGIRTGGIKLSLFDVKDVKNPKEIDTYILGDSGSDSIANHDHKAFLFSLDKNLLSIPVSIREDTDGMGWGKFVFGGAVVFKIDETGFGLKGKIDHSDGGLESKSDYWRGHSYYDNTVRRSLYIDDTLYTFSNDYLMMNRIDDLDEIKKLKLEKKRSEIDEDDFEVIN